MMQTFSTAVMDETKRLIGEEYEIETGILNLGNVPDYAAYRERVGRLYAYRKAMELFEVAQSNLEKRG